MSEQQALSLAQPKKRGHSLWSVMLVLGGVVLGYLGRGHITFLVNEAVPVLIQLTHTRIKLSDMADEIAGLINDLKKSGDPASADRAIAYTARYASSEASGTSTPLVVSLGRNRPSNRAACALLKAEARSAPRSLGERIQYLRMLPATQGRKSEDALPKSGKQLYLISIFMPGRASHGPSQVCDPNGQCTGGRQRYSSARKDDMQQRLR